MTIVLLIVTYYILRRTKSYIHKKELDESDIERKSIRVKTVKGDIYMDPNIFEMHINRMKDNISKLNESLTSKDCKLVKNYLDRAKISARNYININSNNMKADFCKSNNLFKLINDNVLQERDLLKKKMTSKSEQDSEEDNRADHLRSDILELLTDMDIILFLVRSSLCKKGKMDLSLIDQLVLELYRANCEDEQDHSNEFDTNYFQSRPDPVNLDVVQNPSDIACQENFSHRKISNKHADSSQQMFDGTSIAPHRDKLSNKFKDDHIFNSNERGLMSHGVNKDFRPNIPISRANRDKRKPKTYKDYTRVDPRNKEVDAGARQSLLGASR